MTTQQDRPPTEADDDAFSRTVLHSKPWGHEAAFATGEHGYVGKILTVDAGHGLSLQYHEAKDETLTVLSGEARLELGASQDALRSRVMRPGDIVHLAPLVLHRLTAVTDVVLAEVSTAPPGWREDVVRLADRYGRVGTTRP